MRSFFDNRLFWASLVPLMLIGFGTTGYVLIEDWDWFDGLYMTVITLTTVGFLEVHDMSKAGRVFTMVLALGGAVAVASAATVVLRAVVSGEINRLLGTKRMQRMLASMKDHVIVCGYGRVGRRIVQELRDANVPHVVVDRDPARLTECPLWVSGDVNSDDILRRAGIDRARALVTVVPSDADNLFVTMSAHLLNEKLVIVARAESEDAEKKLIRAGATRVVCPTVIGGQRVVQAVLRPAVLDFIDLATRNQHLELQMEQMVVAASSSLAGLALGEAQLNKRANVLVVAIQGTDGRMRFNPAAEDRIAAGDKLVCLGSRASLDKLQEMAGPRVG